jgi:uncharacterized protein YgiM (DUF1202 family)
VRKLLLILGILIVIGAVIAAVLFFLGVFSPKGAGLKIDTNPASTVFIDGQQVGKTPFQTTRKAGEITLRLVPDSFNQPLSPYETKIDLVAGIETVVQRDFGATDDDSGGYIISFERVGGSETSIAVSSVPDAAQISLDGNVVGFSPYKTSSLTAGDHELLVTAPNYKDEKLNLKAVEGYKLTARVKLMPNGESPEPSPTPAPAEKMVEIENTPTGFLRVRSEPSTSGTEVGQVTPGKTYKYVDTDTATGWFKIEYEAGKDGWISNQYAKIVENASPSPSASPTPSSTP